MASLRARGENVTVLGRKPLETRNKVVRKPLRGVENKIRNEPVKASFKEKPKATVKENIVKQSKPKPTKKESEEKEVLENIVPQLLKTLPEVVKSRESSNRLPENIENIDADDSENPQLVSIYVNDIYRYMRKLEMVFPIRKSHMQLQPEITGKMRAVLVDWLVQVHIKFQLLQETLYLTVSILDRYLQIEYVRRTDLQLVGVTAMFIASKYEEMYAPEIGDFVYITDNTYSKEDIFKTERKMLRQLDFNLSKPLPLHFLRRNSKAGNVDATIHALAKYLMEIVLPEYEMAHYQPSILAAAALFLALKLLTSSSWSDNLKYYSTYSEEEILPIAKNICKILIKAETSKFQAVHLKYASSKLYKISTIPQLKSSYVKELAGVKK